MKILISLLYSLVIISLITLGWFSNDLYNEYNNERKYNGLRFVENNSHAQALARADVYDKFADWVCINSKHMTFKECTETAQHECAHEILAEEIGKKPELMEKVMEVIEK